MQQVGQEWGVTTGRKRRCGWLDLVVLRYSHMINDYTSINLTKLDVLDDLDEIKIGVEYKHNGQLLTSFPADLDILGQVEVVYETLPGWKEDISKCRSFDALPENAQKYVKRIQEILQVHGKIMMGHSSRLVEWIGVGASRDAMIHIPL